MTTRSHPRLVSPGPRLRPVAPDGTEVCPRCDRRMAQRRWEEALRVCLDCGHHSRVPAAIRVTQLADPGTATLLDLPAADHDPLGFDDGVSYVERQRAVRLQTGSSDAVLVARAAIEGVEVAIVSMEFEFFGGSLGSAAGEAFARACEIAVAERRSLVSVCVSGGARMQEGIVALAQMARCTAGTLAVAAARLPYVSVLADPCFGGVTASFATQADVILAEPGARIGFAGGRVIEQATYERLPDGFQTAEFLLSHGMVDAIVERRRLRQTIAGVLRPLTSGTR